MSNDSHPSIELLAPAGEPRALRAALAAGADAVYLGLERWSARAFAGNFAEAGVVEAVELAHRYGARAHVALNTLLRDDEVEPALAALEAPYLAGLDALIVADLGLVSRVREEYPDLPLHASTQLDTHSSAQIAALARLGFGRAILARELSLAEIAALEPHGLELEAFVHGALCYGYSGDCLLSSMVGGRSGNRGRCSQACRLRYSLRRLGDAAAPAAAAGADVSSGPREPPGSAKAAGAEPTRVMSTSDLAALDALPRLLAAGVTSFKIEGRMKDAAYVGMATAVYREALDAALADPEGYQARPEWRARLEQSFSRSFTTAHLEGRHHEVRSGGRGGHRGVLVGRVAAVREDRGEVEVRLSHPVSAGDLVYLYTPWGQTEPLRLEAAGEASVTLRVRERVAVKDRMFRLAAADAGELARELVSGRAALRPLRLRMRLQGAAGRPPELSVVCVGRSGVGQTAGPAGEAEPEPVTVAGGAPLAPARTAALSADKAREALGALGGTPYRLDALEFAMDEGLFLAVGELKELRRLAVAALDERRLAACRRAAGRRTPVRMATTGAATAPPPVASAPPLSAASSAGPVVLVLRPGERPLAAPGVSAMCLDLLAGDLPDVVAAAAAELRASGVPLRARLPEILFDADGSWLRAVLGVPWDALHVRHLGLLVGLAAAGPALVLEYPLQGLNGLAAGVAAGLVGRRPAGVVASPEAALDEVRALGPAMAADLLHATGVRPEAPAVEILAFGRQQVLHTRDQLGRAEGLYEAPGPGAHIGLLLEDAKGYTFPADADAGGTRLFNARVTNLAGNLDELRAAGVGAFLVVQSDLAPDERRAFASGGLPALAAFTSRERSTTGHLFRGVA